MKTKLLATFALLLALSSAAYGQKPVEPFKVNFAVQGEAGHVEEMERALRSELRKRRDVVVTARRPDYAVDIVLAPVVVDGEVVAFACALLITRKSGGDFLAVVIEADLPELARQLAGRFNQSVFQQSRRGRDKREE